MFYIQLPVCIVPDLAEIKKRKKNTISFPLSSIRNGSFLFRKIIVLAQTLRLKFRCIVLKFGQKRRVKLHFQEENYVEQ